MKTLKILPKSEFKNLKIIRVVGPEWNSFTGYLPYERTLKNEYDYEQGDELDKNLLEAIQKSFPNSNLLENRLIILEGDLEEQLNRLKSGSEKKLTVNFFPFIDIPIDQLLMHRGRSFNHYLIDFKLRLMISTQNEKYNNINDSVMCDVHYEKIDELIETIKPL